MAAEHQRQLSIPSTSYHGPAPTPVHDASISAHRGVPPILDGVTAMLVLVVLLAIAFDYVNGFHDTANAIATSVATRALAPRYAILMATAFNFIGAFAGTAVAKTIASGLVDDAR